MRIDWIIYLNRMLKRHFSFPDLPRNFHGSVVTFHLGEKCRPYFPRVPICLSHGRFSLWPFFLLPSWNPFYDLIPFSPVDEAFYSPRGVFLLQTAIEWPFPAISRHLKGLRMRKGQTRDFSLWFWELVGKREHFRCESFPLKLAFSCAFHSLY